jgi:hypothetical protein
LQLHGKNTQHTVLKKLLRKYILTALVAIGCLFGTNSSFGQTASFANLTGGLSGTTLTAGTSQAPIYGFSVQVSGGSITFTQFNLSFGGTSEAYFANGTLYKSATNSFNAGSPGTAVGNVVFNGNNVTLNNFTETISSTTNYYFLVVDMINTGTAGNNFYANTANFATDSFGGTAYPFYGTYIYYSFNTGTPYQLTVTPQLTGLASTSTVLIAGATDVAMFGFGVSSPTSRSISQLYINSNITTLSQFFSSFTLYTTPTSTYSAGARTAVSGTTVTMTGGYVKIVITGTNLQATSTAKYCWLVANVASPITGTLPVSPQFRFSSGQSNTAFTSVTPAGTFNTPTAFGPTYSMNASTLVVTNLTGGVQSGTITAQQSAVVLFGFSVNSTAAITISNININSNGTPGNYFGGTAILVSNTTNTYATGTKTTAGTVVFSGNYATVSLTTANTIAAAGTRYYFLVADNTGGATSTTIAFNFTSGQSSNAITTSSPASTFNTFNATGNTLTIPAPTYIVTGANSTATNGITSGTLVSGQTDIVLFGFGVQGFGTTPNIVQFNIKTSGVENQLFSNGRLYRSTTNVFPGGSPLYTSGSISISGGGFVNCTVSETIPAGTQYYYWFVADCTNSTLQPYTNYSFNFVSGQSALAIYTNPYSTSYNSYNISGNAFNIGGVFDWAGSTSSDVSVAGNWRVNGGTPGSPPASSDLIRIGVVAYQFPSNQPSFLGSGSASVARLEFGTNNTPTLTLGASITGITTTQGLVVDANAAPTILSLNPTPATITVSSAGQSSFGTSSTFAYAGPISLDGTLAMAAGSTFNLTTTNGRLTNAADITDAGTITVAGQSSNSGTIIQSGSSAVTFSSTSGFTNTGTITLGGTGTFTLGGTLTNSGTISKSTAGNMGFTVITNNSPGSLTLGSGTNSISSTLGNANGATVTLGGTTTITGAVTNTGTLNGGAGTTTFTAAFTNSLTTGVYNGGSANTTFNNTFTNNNTYVASTGTNDFNNTFTNAGTATFPTGSGTTTMVGAFNNNTGSTLTASAGTINFDNNGIQTITNNHASTAVTFNNATFSVAGVKTLAGASGFIINGTTTFSGTASLTTSTAPVTNNGTFNSGAVTNTFGAAFTNGAAGIFNASTSNTTFSAAFANSGTFNGSTSTTVFNGTFANSSTFSPGTATLTFASTFTNNSGGVFTATGGTTTFSQGAAQSIVNNNTTTPVTLFNMKLSGGAFTKTLSGTGKFEIASTGSLEFTTTSTILAAGTALLTLNSDASGSSTVKALLTGNSITGTVNVERYLTGGASYSRGYRLLSSPVGITANGALPNLSYLKNSTYLTGTGGSTNGFDVTGNPTLYFYRENLAPSSANFTAGNYRGVGKINNGTASNFLIDVDATTNTLPAGNGFLFFFRGDRATNASVSTTATADAVVLTSLGVLNQGSVTVTHWTNTPTAGKLLYTSATANSAVRGYNLVGNPYASSIDWDLVTKSNIGNTIYVYNPKLKVYGSYISGSNGVGTNFNGASGTADIIPSGQGFFVMASNTNAALTFNESNKVNNQVTSTTLSLASNADSSETSRYLRIELYKDSLNREDALVFFKNNTQTKYSVDEDAKYLKGNSVVNISSRSSDNVNLAINQQVFPQKREIIPLNVTITSNGTYSINMPEVKNIPAMYDVWLLDNFKKDSLDVKNNPNYSFTASVTDTNSFGAKRFSLVIRPNPLLTVHLLNFTGAKAAKEVKLTWTAENESSYTRYILERSIDGGKSFSVLDSVISAGLGTYTDLDPYPVKGQNIYRLKQVDLTGSISYSTIVPIMYADNVVSNLTANLISVYPNPVSSTLNLSITQAKPEATNYKITITNTSGVVVRSTTSSQDVWQGNVSDLSPGTYIVQIINIKENTVTGKSTFIKL